MSEIGGAVSKAALRAWAKRLLRDQKPEDLEVKWSLLEDRVIDWCEKHLPRASVVTLFGGAKDEVDLVRRVMPVLRAAGHRTVLFATASGSGQMDGCEVDRMDEVGRGPFGIWEPKVPDARVISPKDLDVVFVPGLLFCPETGTRLGRGGGYFDRYLARLAESTRCIGVGLECQLKTGLPREIHDRIVDGIITEKGWRVLGSPL